MNLLERAIDEEKDLSLEEDYSINANRIANLQRVETFLGLMTCIICMNLPMHPLQCKGCESIVCEECYKSWNKPKECPKNCESPKYKALNRTTRKMFSEVQLSCSYQKNGCKDIIAFDSLLEHGKHCKFQKKQCPKYSKCNQKILLKDLNAHIENCAYIKVQCKYCKEKYSRMDLSSHIQVSCPMYPMECSFCFHLVMRKSLKSHEKDCDERDLTCKKCSQSMKKKEKDDHCCIKYLVEMIKGVKTENEDLRRENEEIKRENLVFKKFIKQELAGIKSKLTQDQKQKSEEEVKKNSIEEPKMIQTSSVYNLNYPNEKLLLNSLGSKGIQSKKYEVMKPQQMQNILSPKSMTKLDCCGFEIDIDILREFLQENMKGNSIFYIKDNELSVPKCLHCDKPLTVKALVALFPEQSMSSIQRERNRLENELANLKNACVICSNKGDLKNVGVIPLQCGHKYHKDCIVLKIVETADQRSMFNPLQQVYYERIACFAENCQKKIQKGDLKTFVEPKEWDELIRNLPSPKELEHSKRQSCFKSISKAAFALSNKR